MVKNIEYKETVQKLIPCALYNNTNNAFILIGYFKQRFSLLGPKSVSAILLWVHSGRKNYLNIMKKRK